MVETHITSHMWREYQVITPQLRIDWGRYPEAEGKINTWIAKGMAGLYELDVEPFSSSGGEEMSGDDQIAPWLWWKGETLYYVSLKVQTQDVPFPKKWT